MSVHSINSGEEIKPHAPVMITITMPQSSWKSLVAPIAKICRSVSNGDQIMPISIQEIEAMSEGGKIISEECIKQLTELRDSL